MSTTTPTTGELPPDPVIEGGHVPEHGASRWLVLAIVGLAQFMVVLDATVVNVAMPSIQLDLGIKQSNLQWIINSYTLMFGGFLLLGGRAADLLGRRKLFLAGVSVFTIASMVNGFATSGEMLIIARGFQGLGGALVAPAALSIVTTLFGDGPDRTKALGVWGAIAAGGSAVGLLAGGVLTEFLSWEWTFFVNIPIGLFTIVMALRYVPESSYDHGHRSFDLGGAVTVTGGLIALVYSIVQANDSGWLAAQTLGFFGLAIALLVSFVIIESRHKAPLVRLGIFRMRSLAVANSAMLFVTAGMFAMFFFSSIYLQQVLGYGPLDAGLAFLPVTAAIIIASGAATKLIGTIGVKAVTGTGLLLATIGMTLWTTVGVDSTYVTGVLGPLAVIAFGMGLVFVPATLVATTNVEEADGGLASGIFNTSQQIGGALGLAILSTVAAGATERSLKDAGADAGSKAQQLQSLVDGFHLGYLVAAGFLAVALIVFVSGIRKQDVAAIESGEIDMTAMMG